MSRDSTSWASGSGAVTRRMGSSGKNTVPSGIACTSPVKRSFGEMRRAILAETAAALQPLDFLRREAQVLQELERLLQPRRYHEIALRRQLPHEELEYRRLGLP